MSGNSTTLYWPFDLNSSFQGSPGAVGVLVDAFGADPTGINDSTGAIASAISSLPASGGTIIFTNGGNYSVSNLTITKPTLFQFGSGGMTQRAGATGPMLTVNQNVVLQGQDQYETVLTANAGQVCVAITSTWNSALLPGFTGDLGTQVFITRDIGFKGGTRSIDTSGITEFSQGTFYVHDCRFYGTSDVAIYIQNALSFSAVEFCQFSQCNGSMWIGNNTETKCYNNQHYPANASTNPNITLDGPFHVEIKGDSFEGALNYTQPDILIISSLDGVGGYCKIERNNFAPEREYAWNKNRPRILYYTSANPTWSVVDVTIRENYFYASSPPIMPVASIITTSGASRKVTITLHSGETDSGIQVGDTFSLVQMADASFAGGPFTVTARTANTLTWTTTSASASQGAGGFVLPGSLAAIVIKSPPGRFDVDDNYFYGYPILVNDDFSYSADFSQDIVGHCVWGGGNRYTGFLGRDVTEFQNGGQYFTRGDLECTTSFEPLIPVPRSNETIGLLNRISNSESPAAGTGMTVTTGETDPYGTTRAVLLTRAGAAQQWLSPGIGETASCTLDIGGTFALPTNPALSYLSFWAKMGGSNPSKCLSFYILGASANSMILQYTATLSSNWKRYSVPIVWPANAGTLGGVTDIVFSPGTNDPEPTTALLFGVAVCDQIPGDYVPTTVGPVQSATLGNRFQMGQQHAYLTPSAAVVTDANSNLASLAYTANPTASTLASRDASGFTAVSGLKFSGGGTPVISGVGAGIGSSGTVTLDTGSTDESGIILLNPGGTGITNVLTLNFAFSTSLPGHTPVIDFQLIDGAASWGTGVAADLSTVRAFSFSNSGFSLIATNQHWTGSTVSADNFTSGAAQYQIAYRVTFK